MKLMPLSLVLAALAAPQAHGQAFTNLNFEAAVVAPVPPLGNLDWTVAVPGWTHSAGTDTASVYYGFPHVGLTQWFLLVGSATLPNGPLQGNYSLRFVSGHVTGDPASPWVNAYVSQVGWIPDGTRSLTLLATGPLAVTLNGIAAPLVPLAGTAYAVDVTAFAGSVVDLRLINASTQGQNPLTVDALAFSTTAIPEPTARLLMCLGVIGLIGVLARSRRRPV